MSWKRVDVQQSGISPGPRAGHAVVAVADSLLLFGGADRSPRAYDDLWQLKLGKGLKGEWTRISAGFPASVSCTARSGAAFVTVGGKAYLFGGQEPNTGLCFNDVLELDTNNWTWTQLQVEGPRPPARHSCVAVSFRDQCMLVFGGAGFQGSLSDVWLFDCLNKTWSSPSVRGPTPTAREMAAGVLLTPERLLVFGGRASDGRVLDDVAELNTGEHYWTWSSSCSTGLKRCAHTVVALPAVQQQQQQQQEQLNQQQGEDTDTTAQDNCKQQPQPQQLLVFGGFSGEAVEGSLWALQQQQQATDTPGACGWSAKQLHTGVVVQPVESVNQSGSSSSAGSSSASSCPAPRFAHAAACLPDPDQPMNQVMVLVAGVNQVKDLMDVYVWRP